MRWPIDAVARRHARITLLEVLHETQPPDETGLVRLLCLLDYVVEFCLRQMLHQKTLWTALHHGLYASNGINSFADHSCRELFKRSAKTAITMGVSVDSTRGVP